jgi:hypothetical protein
MVFGVGSTCGYEQPSFGQRKCINKFHTAHLKILATPYYKYYFSSHFPLPLSSHNFFLSSSLISGFIFLNLIACNSIQSLALISCPISSPSAIGGITPLPSSLFNTTSSSGLAKYTKLYLVSFACSPGGLTTLWIFERSKPFVNFTIASPKFTIQ